MRAAFAGDKKEAAKKPMPLYRTALQRKKTTLAFTGGCVDVVRVETREIRTPETFSDTAGATKEVEALEAVEREAPAQPMAPASEDARGAQIQSQLAALEQQRRECEELLEKLPVEPGAQPSTAAHCGKGASPPWAATRRSPSIVRSI